MDTTMDQSVFEGLFVRALKLDPPFIEELVKVGYDPRAPQARYPGSVWRAALRVACRRVHPGLPEEKALYELGKAFMAGFDGTIIGKMLLAMIPFFGPDTLVKRLPKFVTMTSTGIGVTIREAGPGTWIGSWTDPNAAPEFVEGLFSYGLQRSKLSGLRLLGKRPGSFELEFKAPAKQ